MSGESGEVALQEMSAKGVPMSDNAAPLGYLLSAVKGLVPSAQNLLKKPKRIIPAAVLATIWMDSFVFYCSGR